LARTREYVSVVRQVLSREAPVTNAGPHYPLPYTGPGSTGLGKPLRSITHPLRADLPIWLGAEGPKNVALAAEIADGWLAVFHPIRLAGLFEDWLAEGFARAGARRQRTDFEVVTNCQIIVTNDPAPARRLLKPSLAHYIARMGAPDMNFHADLFRRLGYGEEVARIVTAAADGRWADAVEAVPDELVDETAIIGDADRVRAEVARREAAGI
jgi:F420-dependent oxidoreductase-like protein